MGRYLNESPGLASLLSALREAGIVIGIAELARLRQIFALAPRIADTEPKQKLKSLLRSVLVKSTEEAAAFERVCEDWLKEAEILVLPEPDLIPERPGRISAPERKRKRSKRYYPLASLVVLLLALAAGILYYLYPRPEPEKSTLPPEPPTQIKTEPTKEFSPDKLRSRTFESRKPALTVIPPQGRWTGWWEQD
jgi:hypothetical protein